MWVSAKNIALFERVSHVTACLHPSCPVNYLHASRALGSAGIRRPYFCSNRLDCLHCSGDYQSCPLRGLISELNKRQTYVRQRVMWGGGSTLLWVEGSSRKFSARNTKWLLGKPLCAMMGNGGIWLRSLWLFVGCGYTSFAAVLHWKSGAVLSAWALIISMHHNPTV